MRPPARMIGAPRRDTLTRPQKVEQSGRAPRRAVPAAFSGAAAKADRVHRALAA